MRDLSIAYGSSRQAKKWVNKTVKFDGLKERFLNVDYEHIQYIIDCFKENAKMKEIKNIKQYLKAAIFNAPTTIDSYFTAMVQRDMYGY